MKHPHGMPSQGLSADAMKNATEEEHKRARQLLPKPRFQKNAIYALEGWQLEAIWQEALRLYSEQRLDGDTMRNMAQKLDAMLGQADKLDERGG